MNQESDMLNDLTAPKNVFVTMLEDIPIVTYRLETMNYRHHGLSMNIIEGSPIGDINIGFKIYGEIVYSFKAITHKNIHNELQEKYVEYFI